MRAISWPLCDINPAGGIVFCGTMVNPDQKVDKDELWQGSRTGW